MVSRYLLIVRITAIEKPANYRANYRAIHVTATGLPASVHVLIKEVGGEYRRAFVHTPTCWASTNPLSSDNPDRM
jgi:hypothetical protein